MATFTINGLVYKIQNDNEVILKRTEGLKRPVRNIPAEVENDGKKYKVTKVSGGYDIDNASGAFQKDELLSNVSFPETIVSITNASWRRIDTTHGAFKDCIKLKDIYFPDSLVHIGDTAFMGCTAIETLYFGNNLSDIGHYAFYGCTALKDIDFNDKLEEIGRYAFENCSSLKNVSFPESLKRIESEAFKGCKAMTEVNIPSSVESIGNNAFSESGVKLVNIYSENINISANAFPADAQINFLDANSFPKRKRKPRGTKNADDSTANHMNKESEKATPKEVENKEIPKVIPVDMEKLIQAALVDGVVTDKERAILIKKVKEAGGDTDEFELLLDARIYEVQQKNEATKAATPKPEPSKPQKEETAPENDSKPKVEKVQAEKKPQHQESEEDLPNESVNSDSGWSREKWENMEKDVKPALKIMDAIVAEMPCIKDGSYQLNYASKQYIGFAQNGKAKNFATFAPQPKALVVNAWGMADSEEIGTVGKALPNFEHKVTSRNVSYHTFKFPVDKALTAEQTKAALTILEMARKNYEK